MPLCSARLAPAAAACTRLCSAKRLVARPRRPESVAPGRSPQFGAPVALRAAHSSTRAALASPPASVPPRSARARRRRAQAYVGTFLRRAAPAVDAAPGASEAVGAAPAAAPAAPPDGAAAEASAGAEAGAGPAAAAAAAEDPAAGLYEVGTFCQVEMMAETEFGAQLLLQGHRRLRRTRTAGAVRRPRRPPALLGMRDIASRCAAVLMLLFVVVS